MKFVDLRLSEPILRALQTEGYSVATPIQAEAIPHALAGRDVIGVAQTGTGKTAAFALPILHRLSDPAHTAGASPKARCLVLCPTRELATQIDEGFRAYGRNLPMRRTVIFGGIGQRPQVDALRRGLDIIVATPGRLLDLMQQGFVDLSKIEVLVLDEADRMLDMGFIHDIKKIIAKVSQKKQTMLFSATMPGEIRRLADDLMKDPAVVKIAPPAPAAELIEQCLYFVEKRYKPQLLAHLVEKMPMSRVLVFTRTKHGADRVVRQLHRFGIKSEAIHGNKSQNARQRALSNFKTARVPVLVATDVASRGIDIDDISHVVNFDLTHEPETYVHRIGRTGRAGASGMAVSFCDQDERSNLRAIERLIKKSIPVRDDHPTYVKEERTEGHHDEHRRDDSRGHREGRHESRHEPRHEQRREQRVHPHPVGRGAGHSGQGHGVARAPAPQGGHSNHSAGRPQQHQAQHPKATGTARAHPTAQPTQAPRRPAYAGTHAPHKSGGGAHPAHKAGAGAGRGKRPFQRQQRGR